MPNLLEADVVDRIARATHALLRDGILTMDEQGFKLTPEGEYWWAMRKKYKAEVR